MRLDDAHSEHYHCLSLVERAATLIQGELFGYEAGAFTGAERDTPGWLELCPSGGRLLLDELYQRLAVDEIKMPSLRDQLADAPGELEAMVRHVAVKMRGPEQGERLAEKAIAIIAQKRGPRYLRPGNFREVERTVRRIFLHDKDVHASPSTKRPAPASDTAAALGRDILAGRLTMAEIERRVVLAVFQKTRSQRRGAILLGIDRERFAKRLREALGEGKPET